jgi:hypothetical protein
MVRDEAPSATIGGFNGIRNVTALKSARRTSPGLISGNGPTSLVAAEIHPGLKASGHLRRLAALQYSSCVPRRFEKNITLDQWVVGLAWNPAAAVAANFGQLA